MKHNLSKALNTLQTISKIIDNIKCKCASSVYTIDDDEMSWIYYCRDLADLTVKDILKEETDK